MSHNCIVSDVLILNLNLIASFIFWIELFARTVLANNMLDGGVAR